MLGDRERKFPFYWLPFHHFLSFPFLCSSKKKNSFPPPRLWRCSLSHFFLKALLWCLSLLSLYCIWNWFCVWCESGVKIVFFSIWLPNWPSTIFWKITFSSPLFFNFHAADSCWICGQPAVLVLFKCTALNQISSIQHILHKCSYLCLFVVPKQETWCLFLMNLLLFFSIYYFHQSEYLQNFMPPSSLFAMFIRFNKNIFSPQKLKISKMTRPCIIRH